MEVESGGHKHVFEIVGTYEVDVLKGKISDQSPIGRALQGRVAGDEVAVQTARGTVRYRILEVRYE